MNYSKLGYINVSAVSPKVHLANPLSNAKEIIKSFKSLSKENLVVCFPELSLTGYTCEDLFLSHELLESTKNAISLILKETKDNSSIIIFGSPFLSENGALYNCAFVCQNGKIIGAVPKIHLPNYNEFYEKRWFTSGFGILQEESFLDQNFTLGSNQLFQINNLTFGIEVCEDLWSPVPPSCHLALCGAQAIFNLSASNELVYKKDYREELVRGQSGRLNCAYIYAGANLMESSKDVVFGGHCLIAENGTVLENGKRFSIETTSIQASIDLNKISSERFINTTFTSSIKKEKIKKTKVENNKYSTKKIYRSFKKLPFVPPETKMKEITSEILQIQSMALARRLLSINKPKIVLGLSGGLDSTLALLVALEAVNSTGQSTKDIIAISMPGFGTSDRTRNQASKLAKLAKVSFKEIDITKTTLSHFKDIGHKENQYDTTYENAQARERTQILFDLANKEGGIVLGTGDLSEIALGWSTYNGDHMSSYNVNSSIPKTLVKFLVKAKAEDSPLELKETLLNILNTEISPELLPIKNKEIQSTEKTLGDYVLHDFFLFHFVRSRFSYEKILVLANIVFKENYTKEEIEKTLKTFQHRFKTNQFKRTVMTAGVKVGSVSLSPRGDWRMPDET